MNDNNKKIAKLTNEKKIINQGDINKKQIKKLIYPLVLMPIIRIIA